MALNFHHRKSEEPEINLIPFIDVLLVILIFLMLSTTYNKFAQLKITLPTADAEKLQENKPAEIIVGVSADGRYMINSKAVDGLSAEVLATEMLAAADGQADRIVIISADASASHQSVVNVMDAARRAGLARLTFATQTSSRGGAR